MKNIIKKISVVLIATVIVAASGCSSQLDTVPTNQATGTTLFENVTNAQTALDGIYRALYTWQLAGGWIGENGGIMAYNLVGCLMGEDQIQHEAGPGWFTDDYKLNVYGDYTSKKGRSYNVWYYFYYIIANTNYIIAEEKTLSGDANAVKDLMGQAYALRALSYWYLTQYFCQHSTTAPGVPVYTEPTTATSEGKGRGTVAEDYAQMTSDAAKAVELLKAGGLSQVNKSHIDLAVAYGIQARIALLTADYTTAYTAATNALSTHGSGVANWADVKVINDASKSNVMWGLLIETSQNLMDQWANFIYYMDADVTESYASRARQCIDYGLWKLIPATDYRLAWWNGAIANEEEGNSKVSYCQQKFKFLNSAAGTGDFILMRTEEMVLIAAEAACQKSDFTNAKTYLEMLESKRDPNYAARLASLDPSKTYQTDTKLSPVSYMDEVLFQRRVELWSELPRIFDLQRLGLGYTRDYTGSNQTQKVVGKNTGAGSKYFILPIPQAEIDGNANINSSDQNPEP